MRFLKPAKDDPSTILQWPKMLINNQDRSQDRERGYIFRWKTFTLNSCIAHSDRELGSFQRTFSIVLLKLQSILPKLIQIQMLSQELPPLRWFKSLSPQCSVNTTGWVGTFLRNFYNVMFRNSSLWKLSSYSGSPHILCITFCCSYSSSQRPKFLRKQEPAISWPYCAPFNQQWEKIWQTPFTQDFFYS